jgi:hypothetical protein
MLLIAAPLAGAPLDDALARAALLGAPPLGDGALGASFANSALSDSPTAVALTGIGITNYTQLPGAALLDLAHTNHVPALFNLLGINVTSPHELTHGAFGGVMPGGVDDPGDDGGFISTNIDGPITYTFSSPVAAFGATFSHDRPNNPLGLGSPALIEAFDASNNLVGSVTSSGALSTTMDTLDFVAVWSTQRNIKTARFSSSSGAFAVDAYGLSLTPLPEPSSEIAFAASLIITQMRGRRKRSKTGDLRSADIHQLGRAAHGLSPP